MQVTRAKRSLPEQGTPSVTCCVIIYMVYAARRLSEPIGVRVKSSLLVEGRKLSGEDGNRTRIDRRQLSGKALPYSSRSQELPLCRRIRCRSVHPQPVARLRFQGTSRSNFLPYLANPVVLLGTAFLAFLRCHSI